MCLPSLSTTRRRAWRQTFWLTEDGYSRPEIKNNRFVFTTRRITTNYQRFTGTAAILPGRGRTGTEQDDWIELDLFLVCWNARIIGRPARPAPPVEMEIFPRPWPRLFLYAPLPRGNLWAPFLHRHQCGSGPVSQILSDGPSPRCKRTRSTREAISGFASAVSGHIADQRYLPLLPALDSHRHLARDRV